MNASPSVIVPTRSPEQDGVVPRGLSPVARTACLADAGHQHQGLFPASLAKTQTMLVTLGVIVANTPSLGLLPLLPTAPHAPGRKTAASTNQFLLS